MIALFGLGLIELVFLLLFLLGVAAGFVILLVALSGRSTGPSDQRRVG
jgi:hypothetical protein